MNLHRLLLENLRHYWRTNLAVVLGVAAATAVIGGALLVGDSVRSSLTQMSLDRVGNIDHLLTGPRFFRQELAQAIATEHSDVIAPALVMQGTVEFGGTREKAVRAGHIQVYGLNDVGWGLLEHASIPVPETGQVVVNQRVADQLSLQTGSKITLIVEIPASIPRDALLGDREETVTTLDLEVSAITPDDLGISRLGFNPTQQLPLNVFVSLDELQQQTGLAAVEMSKRNPVSKPARVNTLLIQSAGHISPDDAQMWTEKVHQAVTLDDLALKVKSHPEYRYISLESEQMILENGLAETAQRVADNLQIPTSPVLVYLLNEMWNVEEPQRHSMYSVIAGVDLHTLPSFDFASSSVVSELHGNEAIINTWLANDLNLGTGGRMGVKYHVVGDRGELPEDEQTFEIAAVVELIAPTDDPGFTPDVPGVTDAKTYADWREPFPLKRDLITERDDDYWEEFRTVPKVFIGLEKAQELWRSRYGKLTTLRLSPNATESLDDLNHRFSNELLRQLKPETTGLVVQPIKAQGLMAAQGSTDFAGLFIGFSFFLILAATMLVGLLFRLGIEQRSQELGLLQAVGLPPKVVGRMFLLEGLLLVLLGAIVGTGLAIGYAALMIHGLKTWWIGAIGTRFLFLDVQPVSLSIGALIAIVVALAAIWWALRQTHGLSSRQLLSGIASADQVMKAGTISRLAKLWSYLPLTLALLLAAATFLGLVPDQEAFGGFSWRVVMFFLVGTCMLWGLLSVLSLGLQTGLWGGVSGSGIQAETALAMRNASRNRGRSMLTTSLLAMAAFVIMAVAAGQQNPTQEEPRPRSGNGGFTLVAESNLPLLYDLNTSTGRAKLGFDNASADVRSLLDHAWVAPFRVRPGENASCLNLYQTHLPTILGVPQDVLQKLIDEQRFTFADTPHPRPWELLQEQEATGEIPVLGDMNTLMYSLHLGIGNTVSVPAGEDTAGGTLKIKGMFANSVFQGVLVMSEENFLKLFPSRSGFRYFLIECDPAQSTQLSDLLERQLGDSGFDAEPVADRLADFLAVQNTYLSTFQTLGGLGLLLGTLGLATVMLRNVLERRSELALLRAVGLSSGAVGRIVLWEHILLMMGGLATGTVAALVAMGPHLLSTGADVPWPSLLGLLASVFTIGLLTAVFAIRAAVCTPILTTLRGE